jgi:TRAP-type mannitol/chloroaromatic compound transport system substrate-binding protein
MALDRYSKDLQELINKDGVKVVRTPKSIMEAQLKSWDKVLETLNQDPFFKKVVDSQRAWAERVGYYYLTNAADYELAFNHYFPGKLAKG